MSCLAVDKDGTEWVWSYCPLRNKYRGVSLSTLGTQR